MAATGHEIATAYVSVVPSFAGAQYELAKNFSGVSKQLAKEVDAIPQVLRTTFQKVSDTVGKQSEKLLGGTVKGLRNVMELTGTVVAQASGVGNAFSKASAPVRRFNDNLSKGAEAFTAVKLSAKDGVDAIVRGFRGVEGPARTAFGNMALSVGAYSQDIVSWGGRIQGAFKAGFEGTEQSASTGMSRVAEIAGGASRSVMDWAGRIKAIYQREWNAVPGYAANPLREVVRIAGSAAEAIGGKAQLLSDGFKAGIAGWDRASSKGMERVGHIVGKGIHDIRDKAATISSHFQIGFRGVETEGAKGFNRLANVVGRQVKRITDRAGEIKNSYHAALYGLQGPAATGMARVAQIVGQKVREVTQNAEAITKSFRLGFSGIANEGATGMARLANVVGQATGNLKQIFGGFGDKAKAVFDTFGPMAGQAFQKVATAAGTMVQQVISVSQKIVGGVTSAIGKVGQGIKQSLVVPATAAVTAGMAAIGTSMKQGLSRLNTIDIARKKMVGLGLDTQQSARIMKSAEQSVLGTVYGLDEAATVASGAIAAGVKEGQDLDDTLKAMVNTAAAANRPLEDIGYIFNNVAATNQAYTQQINQVARSGIPMWQELAKVMGVNETEVRKLVSQGKVGFEEFRQAAMNATGDIADEMGKTLPGALENLKNAFTRFGANLWKGFETEGPDGEVIYSGMYQRLAPLIVALTKAMKPLEQAAERVGDAIANYLNPAIEWLTAKLEAVTSRTRNVIDVTTGVVTPVNEMAGSFKNIMELLKPFVAILIPLGAAGMGELTQVFGRFRPLLGPIPEMLGALGSSAGIAAFALYGLSKVDPERMAIGFQTVAARIPEIFQNVTITLMKFANRILPDFLNALSTNLPVLVDGLMLIVDTILDLFTTAKPLLMNVFKSIFNSIGDVIQTVLPVIVTVITELIPALAQVLLGGIPLLLAAAVDLFTSLVEAVQTIIPAITEMAFTIVTNLAMSLLEYAPQLVTAALELVVGLAEAILSKIPTMIGAFTTMLVGLVEALVGMGPALVDALLTAVPLLINSLIILVDELVAALIDLFPAILGAVSDLLPMVVKLLADGIPALLIGALNLFLSIVDGLVRILPPLLGEVAKLIPEVIGALLGMLPMLLEGAIMFFTALVDGLIYLIPTLIDAVINLVLDVLGAIIEMIPQLLDAAITFFMALVDALPLIVEQLVTAVMDLLPVLIETLTNMLPELILGAMDLYLGFAMAIPLIIPDLVDAILALLPVIIDTVIGLLPELLQAAVQLFMGIVLAIPRIVGQLAMGILELLPTMVGALLNMIMGLGDAALRLFLAIPAAIPEMLGSLGEALGEIWTNIHDFFVELPGKALELGKDLINGFIGGIQDKATGAVEAVKDMGSKVLGGIKGFFGISSPSRVMAEIGGFLDQGLSQGIEGGGTSIAAVNQMSAEVVGALNVLQAQVTKMAKGIGVAILSIMGPLKSLMGLMKGQFRNTVTREIRGVADAFQKDFPRAVNTSTNMLRATLSKFTSWFTGSFGRSMVQVIQQVTRQMQTLFQRFASWFAGSFTNLMGVSSARMVTGLRRTLEGFQRWFGGTFQTGLLRALSAIQAAFVKLPTAVNTAWSKLKTATRNPTNYVIQTVYMRGIRSAVNAINKAVGVSGSMPAVPSVGYAKGTPSVLPGYSPGVDNYTFYNPKLGFLRLGGGEAILRPEVTKALGGAPTINAWNRSKGKGVGKVGDRGYATGGIIDFLRKHQTGWDVDTKPQRFMGRIFDDPKGSIRGLVTDPAREYGGRAGGALWGRGMAGSMVQTAKGYESVFARKIEKLGLTQLVASARGALGVPYIWGGSSVPPGLDCSGLVYWALNRMGKDAPRLTAAGYQSVATPVSSPRPGDAVFWGNPASHIAISTGGSGIIHAPRPGSYVTETSLYGNPTFGRLPYDDGGWLQPGLTLAENRTGKPEPVFTSSQWEKLGRPQRMVVERAEFEITEDSKVALSNMVLRESGLYELTDARIESKVGV